MITSDNLNKAKILISKDRIKEAINTLFSESRDGEYFEELSIQSSRLNSLNKRIRINDISHENANIEMNRIRAAILEMISELESIYFGSSIDFIEGGKVRIAGNPPRELTKLFKDRISIRNNTYAYFNDESVRLVTLIGRGGIGKTAIALKVLSDIEKGDIEIPKIMRPLKGIVYYSTRTINKINLQRVFQNISNLFFDKEIRQKINDLALNDYLSTPEKVIKLEGLLSSGCYILFFDQMESLLNEEGKFLEEDLNIFFDEILRNKSSFKIIATSRLPLKVRYDVKTLVRNEFVLDGIDEMEGIQLLRELDKTTSKKKLGNKTDEQLKEIVQLVKGVPRALELVSSIIEDKGLITLEKIKTKFFKIPDIMSELIEQAYSNQNEDSKRILEALSVFKKAVPVSAIEFLLSPFYKVSEIEESIEKLYNIHIVEYSFEDGLVGLHPIDIDYAYNRIPDSGDYSKQALELRAAEYYAESFGIENNKRAIRWADPFFNQFEHLINAKAYSKASILLNETGNWLVWQGYAKRVKEMLSTLANNVKDELFDKAYYARCLGNVYTVLGPLDNAIKCFSDSLNTAKQIEDFGLIGDILIDMGVPYRFLGETEKAKLCFQEALEMYKKTPGEYDDAIAYRQLARVYVYMGNVVKCIENATKALEIDIKRKDNLAQGQDKSILCLGYLLKNDLEKAKQYAEESITILKEAQERDTIGYILNNLGLINLYKKDYVTAENNLIESLKFSIDNNQPRNEGLVKFNLAWLYSIKNNTKEAKKMAQESFALFNERKANEAKPAKSLLNYLIAIEEKDVDKELNQLILCADLVGTNPDLYDGQRIAQLVKTKAIEYSRENFEDDANKLIENLKERITTS